MSTTQTFRKFRAKKENPSAVEIASGPFRFKLSPGETHQCKSLEEETVFEGSIFFEEVKPKPAKADETQS
jgi:hypothetical protein